MVFWQVTVEGKWVIWVSDQTFWATDQTKITPILKQVSAFGASGNSWLTPAEWCCLASHYWIWMLLDMNLNVIKNIWSLMSQRKSPRGNRDGGGTQSTKARARPEWVLQGEGRVPIGITFSSIFVPAHLQSILEYTCFCKLGWLKIKFPHFNSFAISPLTLEELCMAIKAGSCLQNLGSDENSVAGQLNAYSWVKLRAM